MKKTTAIIIDDEKMARSLLRAMLQEVCPEVDVLEACQDLPSGVKMIRKLQPDIVFLDIEMPNHSGLELLDFFNPQEINFSIIFTTAYNQYAIQAFKLSAIDYLLKPIEPQELEAAVNRHIETKQQQQTYQVLNENLQADSQKKIAIHSLSSIRYVDLKDIVYLKADGAYCNIYLNDKTIITASKNLKSFESTLAEQEQFLRCQKSYIINLEYVKEYVKSDGGYLRTRFDEDIPISQDNVNAFLALMAKWG